MSHRVDVMRVFVCRGLQINDAGSPASSTPTLCISVMSRWWASSRRRRRHLRIQVSAIVALFWWLKKKKIMPHKVLTRRSPAPRLPFGPGLLGKTELEQQQKANLRRGRVCVYLSARLMQAFVCEAVCARSCPARTLESTSSRQRGCMFTRRG